MLPSDMARSWSATQGAVSPSAVSVEAKDIGTCQRTRSCAATGAASEAATSAATAPLPSVLGNFIIG